MDFLHFLDYLVYASLGVGGWFLRQLWDAVQNLRKDLSLLREELARDYMPRTEIRTMFENIIDEIRLIGTELRAHEQREFAWTKQIVSELGHKVDK